MRKYRRQMIRLQAEKERRKHPSEIVRKVWEKYQIKKYGVKRVVINRAKGAHKKELWTDRIATALYGFKKGQAA